MDLSNGFAAVTPTLDGPVLAALTRVDGELSAPEIHRLVGDYSLPGVRKTLTRLVEQGIVTERRAGARAYFYSANRDHLAWPAVEIMARLRTTLFERIVGEIAAWERQPLQAWIFGSLARGEAGPESDVDVLIVRSAMGSDDEWDEQVEKLAEKIEAWTGNSAELLVMTADRFDALADDDWPVLREQLIDVLPRTSSFRPGA